MTDILRLVSEVGRRTFPTLSQLSENDVDSIWADLSAYIERQMTLQKGVHLAGLGTFTFSQQKLTIGNKFTMIQRPIFLLAGKLAQSLGLKQTRPLGAATHLPVVQLNFAAVSQETPFNRDIVEGCIRETLQLLFRVLASEQNVFVPFQGIGVLYFKSNKVRMKFNREFINAMDGTGRVLLAFNNRPDSSVSLLSGGLSKLHRPQTANLITLPTVCSPQPDSKAGDKDGCCLSPAPDQRNAGEDPQQRESKTNQTLQPAKVKPVSVSEELNPKSPMEATNKTTISTSPSEVSAKLEGPHVNKSCPGHARAGQELCYLCMQRAKRNVPVYLREQQEAAEKAQEKLLLFKEQQKDKQILEEEQTKLNEQREHAKLVATFNLRMSEKRGKTSCPRYPTSFIFPARPLTPARRIQQQCYMNDLQNQIKKRWQHEAQDQENRLLMEHLDQVQLVQEIALQKAEQLQQKYERTKHYKRALDTQVWDRKHADHQEDQPESNSGLNPYETVESNVDSRQRAQKLFEVNVSAATQRKKEELHNRHAQLEKEREMLKHNKLELISDHINHFEKKQNIIKSLENEWDRSVRLKHQREEEERRFLRSAGQLLVDKIAQYRRCAQCKRKTTNCGETNIWRDSHYLSGSQYMI